MLEQCITTPNCAINNYITLAIRLQSPKNDLKYWPGKVTGKYMVKGYSPDMVTGDWKSRGLILSEHASLCTDLDDLEKGTHFHEHSSPVFLSVFCTLLLGHILPLVQTSVRVLLGVLYTLFNSLNMCTVAKSNQVDISRSLGSQLPVFLIQSLGHLHTIAQIMHDQSPHNHQHNHSTHCSTPWVVVYCVCSNTTVWLLGLISRSFFPSLGLSNTIYRSFQYHLPVFPTPTPTLLSVLDITLVQITIRTDFSVFSATSPGLLYTISRSICTPFPSQLSSIPYSWALPSVRHPPGTPRTTWPQSSVSWPRPSVFCPRLSVFWPRLSNTLPTPLHGLGSPLAPVHWPSSHPHCTPLAPRHPAPWTPDPGPPAPDPGRS